MAELFGTDRTSVLRHIHNIYKTHELDELATCAKIAQVRLEGRARGVGRNNSPKLSFSVLLSENDKFFMENDK